MRKQYDTDLKIHAVRLATGVSPSIAQVTHAWGDRASTFHGWIRTWAINLNENSEL